MPPLVGSLLTGAASVGAGGDSVVTAAGDCPPAPGLFITDGASRPTGELASVLTAATAPACGPAPPPVPPPGPPDGPATGLTIEFLMNFPADGVGNQSYVIFDCQDPTVDGNGIVTRDPCWLGSHDNNALVGAGFFGLGYYGLSGAGQAGYQTWNEFRGGNLLLPAPPGLAVSAGVHHIALRRTTRTLPAPGAYIQAFVDGVLMNPDPGIRLTSSGRGFPRLLLGGCYESSIANPPTSMSPSLYSPVATFRVIKYPRSDADIAADAAYTLAGNLHPVIPTTIGIFQLQSNILDSGPNGLNMTMVNGAESYVPLGGGSPLTAFNFSLARGMWSARSNLWKSELP